MYEVADGTAGSAIRVTSVNRLPPSSLPSGLGLRSTMRARKPMRERLPLSDEAHHAVFPVVPD
jgi:hypothetical protein